MSQTPGSRGAVESPPATLQWRWHYHLPAVLLAAGVVLIPLIVPGGYQNQLRIGLMAGACFMLLVIDGLSPLFLGALAVSAVVGLAADWQRLRRPKAHTTAPDDAWQTDARLGN